MLFSAACQEQQEIGTPSPQAPRGIPNRNAAPTEKHDYRSEIIT